MTAALDNFVTAARQYCAWCEGPPLPQRLEAQTAYDLLVTLLASMLSQSDPEPRGGEESVDGDEYRRMHARFSSLPFQYYRSQHNPLDVESDGEIGDLADDLADIWLDLKRGLSMLDGGDRHAAAWHWHLLFRAHWGRHATAAVYALHCWLVDTSEYP